MAHDRADAGDRWQAAWRRRSSDARPAVRVRAHRSRACRSRTCSAKPAITFAASGGISGTSPASDAPGELSACSMPRRISMPNSASRPRIMLTSWVRCLTNRSRVRCSASAACCSADLIATIPHRRTRHRLADRLGIARVGLAALDVRLHVGRRHQPHLVTQLGDLARPVVARAARLDPDQAGIKLLEEPSHLRTAQRLADNDFAGAVDGVDLEDVLGQVKADCGNLHRGWLPWLVVA